MTIQVTIFNLFASEKVIAIKPNVMITRNLTNM